METRELLKRWCELVKPELDKITFDRNLGVPISEYNKTDFCNMISLTLDSYKGKTVYFDVNKDNADKEYILLGHQIKRVSDGIYDITLNLQPIEEVENIAITITVE